MTVEATQATTDTAPTVEELTQAAYTAYDAYLEDGSDENKTAAKDAVKVAKDAQTASTEQSTKEAATVAEAAEKNKPPETYDIKAPEDSKLPEEHIKVVSDYAKEHKLTNEQAQAVLERDNGLLVTFAEGQLKELETKKVEWFEQAKADKEIGGDNLEKNVELSKRVTARYATEDFRKILVDTGFGNHPELVRMLTRIGNSMSEDQLEVPTQSGTGDKNPADVLYGKKDGENK